jgi:hypothetical protein
MKKKPLTWQGYYFDWLVASARQQGGRYIIKPDGAGFVVQRQYPFGGLGTPQQAATLTEAQAVAQAHYEA